MTLDLTCRHTNGQSHANNSERRRSNDTRSDLWPADTHTITRKQLETPVKRHSIWPLTCRHTHGQSHAKDSERHRSSDTRSDLWPADTHTHTRKQLETPVKRHSIWPLTCRHTHTQSHANNSIRRSNDTRSDLWPADTHTDNHTQTTRDAGQTTLDLTSDLQTHTHTQTTRRDTGQTTLDLTSDLQTHKWSITRKQLGETPVKRHPIWPLTCRHTLTRKRLEETPVKRHSIWPLTCRHTHNHTQTTRRDAGQTTLDLTSDLQTHTHNHTQTTLRDAGQTTLDLTSDLSTNRKRLRANTSYEYIMKRCIIKIISIWNAFEDNLSKLHFILRDITFNFKEINAQKSRFFIMLSCFL